MTKKTKYNILFLDDDPLVCKTAYLTLLQIASKLKIFSSCAECIDYLQKDSDFDLLLLDYMMPEMTAPEMISTLSSKIDLKNIPIIIQTGMETVDKSTLEKFNVKIIYKPYTKKDLHSLIESSIN